MTTLTIRTEYAWALGCLLALGVWDAIWYGLALGTLVGRVVQRWSVRTW